MYAKYGSGVGESVGTAVDVCVAVGKGVGDIVEVSVGVIVSGCAIGAQAVNIANRMVSSKRFILNSIKFMGWELLKEQSMAALLDDVVSNVSDPPTPGSGSTLQNTFPARSKETY